MQNILIDGLLITCSLCYIIDVSGAVQKLNIAVFKRLYGDSLKYNGWYIPVIGCARCLTFWGCLLYSIIYYRNVGFTGILAVSSLFSYISPLITQVLNTLTCWFSDRLNYTNKYNIEHND